MAAPGVRRPGRQLLLTEDETRRIAANVVKLPELLRRAYVFRSVALSGAPQRGSFEMRTPDQYRELAAECYRMAAEAKTEEHQKILQKMARAWREVAEEIETKS